MQSYQNVAFRTAYLITGLAPEAEDAVQEAFIKAFYALDRFRSGAPFRPWLLRIVANEARNRRTSNARRAALALRAADASTPVLMETEPSPEGMFLAREQRATLLAAVQMLREDDRLVIAYRFFLGLSEEEMAIAIGCARGTVKSRLSRALGRLRDALGVVSGNARVSSVALGGAGDG